MGLLAIVSNAELMKREAQQFAATPEQQSFNSALAGHIRQQWEINRTHKRPVEQIMIQSLRQRRGEYDPEVLSDIRKTGGSEIFMMLTATKCRALAAWITDVLLPANDKAWGVSPTPIPSLPPDIMSRIQARLMAEVEQAMAAGANVTQEQFEARTEQVFGELLEFMREKARSGVAQMEKVIDDQLVDSGWADALGAFIDDFVTYPGAIIKGPVYRRRPKLSWQRNEAGTVVPVVEDKIVGEDERVSPFDLYPSPGSNSPQEGNLIERVRFRRGDLSWMIGQEGYSEQAVRDALYDYGRGGLREWLWSDAERIAQGISPFMETGSDSLIDGLHYWGSASGLMLLEWGVPDEHIPDPMAEYEIEAILIGRHVIRCQINDHPINRRPYFVASFQTVPGSFWGQGPPELMRDSQRMCNAAARAVSNNMGMASGPQVEVQVDRLADGSPLDGIYPWKQWQTKADPLNNNNSPAIRFFQPQSMVAELLAVYDRFERMADDAVNMPRYMYGNERAGGAAATAHGMSLLMDAANKGIKLAVSHVDSGVIRPRIRLQYELNMLDPEVPAAAKMDLEIIARGSTALLVRADQQQRRNEFMQMTANPLDLQILGIAGRAEILRETARHLDMPNVVPSAESIKQKSNPQQQPQQPPQNNDAETKLIIHRETMADNERDRQLRVAEKQLDIAESRESNESSLRETILEIQAKLNALNTELNAKAVMGSGI